MQNMRKGVQVYTVREFIGTQEGYEQSLRKIREIGYDSVQTYGWKVPDAEHKAFPRGARPDDRIRRRRL